VSFLSWSQMTCVGGYFGLRSNEFFLGGASKEQQQGMQEPLHVGRMRRSLAELEVAYSCDHGTETMAREESLKTSQVLHSVKNNRSSGCRTNDLRDVSRLRQ
jgi:hypothetical protein